PTEPIDPINPVDPVDPTGPVNPTEPVDPTEPVNPTEPVVPTEPVDSTEPVDPAEPNEPAGSDRPSPNETLATDPCSANSLLAFQVSDDAILELDDSIVAELQTSRAGQDALCNQPEQSRPDRLRSPSQDEPQSQAVPHRVESDRPMELQVDQPEVQI
ncbi:MAG: hypothetical protein EA367_17500, partial [Leptolyngbya sp. DLM2.Bin15]